MSTYPYYKTVDLRSRKAMTDFLKNHKRYFTANSWNNSTSYANCVKLHALNLPAGFDEDTALAICTGQIECTEWCNTITRIREVFIENYRYHIGFNGRSGGYIVMYEIDYQGQEHGAPLYSIYPGKNIDMNETFEDWSITDLRERTKLVQAFDKACDELRDNFVYIISQGHVLEKTITKRTKTKVLLTGDIQQIQARHPELKVPK